MSTESNSKKSLLVLIVDNSPKILAIIALIIFAVFGLHSCKDKRESKSAEKETLSKKIETYSLHNLWSKPPNVQGGIYPVTVTYQDSDSLAFEHPTPVVSRNSIFDGTRVEKTAYTLRKDASGTWSQTWPSVQGNLRITKQTEDRWFVDQMLNGELLCQFVIVKN